MQYMVGFAVMCVCAVMCAAMCICGTFPAGSRPPKQMHGSLDEGLDESEQQEIQKIISEIHGAAMRLALCCHSQVDSCLERCCSLTSSPTPCAL
jgi:hypothetical protein